MDPTDIGLFRLAERRLGWVDQRQRLLAQNVANANTPGYQSRDLAPFAAALSGQALTQTSPLHMAAGRAADPGGQLQRQSRSPNGNAVSVEDQLAKVADTAGTQELVLNLHHRYQAMFRTALGRAG